jgi:hypothetical protein
LAISFGINGVEAVAFLKIPDLAKYGRSLNYCLGGCPAKGVLASSVLLLVNGALSIEGGFNWYGLIIATGGVKFTGSGGQDKNITGAVMAGETGVLVDTTITGAVNLLYCSYVTNYLRDLPSAIMLSWKEIKG